MATKPKELFSEKVPAGRRPYFFDIKESSNGSKYIVISESQKTEAESFEHNRIMVFEEYIDEFQKRFQKTFIKFRKLKRLSNISTNR